MPRARVAILSSAVCPRHSSTCTKTFCCRWRLQTVLQCQVSWTANLVSLYTYSERA
ncbi:hypothetical protein PF002_g16853 [Phytophthora fragariae]|uniref:Uncharacterized protein n=1 Tax=Phytophthora fragariae TaxID=53985 RepID=A0A6A3YGX9_9STRA|nr:hypothetical protein PF003_g17787 [Phytophthora fragariae]KAE9217241.1 hypothetical protein PF002_g16853 [Phytophthora fragariae]